MAFPIANDLRGCTLDYGLNGIGYTSWHDKTCESGYCLVGNLHRDIQGSFHQSGVGYDPAGDLNAIVITDIGVDQEAVSSRPADRGIDSPEFRFDNSRISHLNVWWLIA